jgi:hypothetical protein
LNGTAAVSFQYVDRVRVLTPTVGSGNLELGAAVPGYRTFADAAAAGSLTSGATVPYVIDDVEYAWESGWGVYTAGTPDTLIRAVTESSLGTAPLSLSGLAQVYIAISSAALTIGVINGGAIDNAAIGATTPSTGAFTTLTVSNALALAVTTLAFAPTITADCALGNYFSVTLTGDTTLANPINLLAGAQYQFTISQDAIGSRTMTYGTAFKFANKTAPTLTTIATAVDILTCFSPDGVNLYAVLSANFG